MNNYNERLSFFPLIIVLFISVFASTVSLAGDINAGKASAAACFGCHGSNGVSMAPNYPNLAGQKEQYLVSAINGYRTGGRNDPTMKAMVASLKDDDVENIAAFFSSLQSK